jgi:CheY-like chemotaxis protein
LQLRCRHNRGRRIRVSPLRSVGELRSPWVTIFRPKRGEHKLSRTIIAVVDDMFFAAKIRATAEALNVEIAFPRNNDLLTAKLLERKPDLMLVDLHNQRIDPIELARRLKALGEFADVPMLGFFSHVQTDLQQAALEAGYDQVIPRSIFSRDLAQILTGG